MSGHADVVVIGLGALGSAAAWQLARRGIRVVGLERFEFGHVRGASHGDSRIIRLSYHTPGYVRSAAEAYDDWSQLEIDSGRRLVLRCGGVDVFPRGAAIGISDYAASMTAADVPFETLDAGEARERWPGLAVPKGSTVLHQERTGIVPASLTTAVLRQRAVAHGALLRERSPVIALREVYDGVEVVCADGARVLARAAVLTTDAWTNRLLAALDVSLPVTVTKEHVIHFDVGGRQEASYAPGAFPVWIWMDDPSYYGFPSYGETTVKVGQDCGGRPVDPDARDFVPEPSYVDGMRDFVARAIPGAGPIRRVTTCLYTLTPDRDFALGPVPGHERVIVGLGAAHGFKFAPWFGEVLADLVTGAAPASPTDDYAVGRERLRAPATTAAERSWLV
jgi:sarcosine oxidase